MKLHSSIYLLFFTLLIGSFSSVTAVEQTVGTIVELADELDRRGKELLIVRMPVRPELYDSSEDAFSQIRHEPHPNTLSGNTAEEILAANNIPVLNLYPDIRRKSLLSDIFRQDRFHFTTEAEKRIARVLAQKLEKSGRMLRPGHPRNVVFMGECFADSFASEIIASDPIDQIKVLHKNGGGGEVHNSLFVFPEMYLEETDLIVWIFTDRHFLNPRFASLEVDPEIRAAESRTVLAKIEATVPFTAGDEQRADYPDALRSSVYVDEKTGERFIGIDRILKNRELTNGRRLAIGQTVRLKLTPWSAAVRQRPALASELLIDETADFSLPRYWVEGWLYPPLAENETLLAMRAED